MDKSIAIYCENKTEFYKIHFGSNSKINNSRELGIDIIMSRTDNRTYENFNYLIVIGDDGEPPENFKFLKKYNVLRLFEK